MPLIANPALGSAELLHKGSENAFAGSSGQIISMPLANEYCKCEKYVTVRYNVAYFKALRKDTTKKRLLIINNFILISSLLLERNIGGVNFLMAAQKSSS